MTLPLTDDGGDGFHEELMACQVVGCHLWEVVVTAAKDEDEDEDQLMFGLCTETHTHKMRKI